MDTGHPFDPTEPALSGYERPYISPYADYGYNRIPPPPPSPPKNRKKWALLFAAILLIGIFGGVATVVFPHLHTIQIALQDVAQVTPATRATPTSLVKPYTAQSVVNEIIARNLQVIGISYGQSIHSWFFSGPYADVSSVPFQSSATWTTSGSCSGPCDGSPMGLWVYSSYGDASTVYQELLVDNGYALQTPPTGPTLSPNPVLYGRCVATGVSDTPYAAIMQQICV